MKAKLLVLLIFLFAFCTSFGQPGKLKYLVLNTDQLRDIGFVIDEHGIFFRSVIPKDKLNKDFIVTTGYYNTKYGSGGLATLQKMTNNWDTIITGWGDTARFGSIPALKLDYHLVKIVEVNGKEIYTSEFRKTKTIAVLVRQSNDHFYNKTDIIVYLKATINLKEKLSYINNLDEYVVELVKE